MRFVKFFLIILFFKESYSACFNNNALSNVSALVHEYKNSRAILVSNKTINLLDTYMYIDVTSVSGNQLCEGTVKNFPRLKKLSLISINLTFIEPGTFQNVPQLQYLYLSVNQLTRISREVFNTIPRLTVIYLTHNQIETIADGAFAKMQYLKEVHLNHNKITQLTGNIFFGSPNVFFVDFSYNLLKKVSKNAFDDLKPENRTSILNIHLKNNIIEELEALAELILVDLHLEWNKINRISPIVFSVKDGSSLYFDYNLIECLADDVVAWIKDKQIIVNLKYNPFNCECIKRIDKLLAGDVRGELTINSTLPCEYSTNLITGKYVYVE